MLKGTTTASWLVFAATVIVASLVDRLMLGRGDRGELHRAALRSVLWVFVGLAFSIAVYLLKTTTSAVDYLVAYLVEKLLSLDNLFVFLVIFRYFGIGPRHQDRVLFFGVVGAMVMRAVFIVTGAAALHRFHWMIYVFGAFLVFTGIKMARGHDAEIDPSQNLALRLARRFLPVANQLDGEHFFTRQDGRRLVTPLFLVLLVIEFSDVLFAVDSVPAVLAVTDDLFVVYTSNVFAILGLRALYFVLADAMGRFSYLGAALSVILVFIGAKMLVSDYYDLPNAVSLAVILITLSLAIAVSLYKASGNPRSPNQSPPG